MPHEFAAPPQAEAFGAPPQAEAFGAPPVAEDSGVSTGVDDAPPTSAEGLFGAGPGFPGRAWAVGSPGQARAEGSPGPFWPVPLGSTAQFPKPKIPTQSP